MENNNLPSRGYIYFYYFIIFYFINGPYLKLWGWDLPYWFLVLFIPFVFIKYLSQNGTNKYVHPIFLVPTLLVVLSLLAKLFLGTSLDGVDFSRMVKYISFAIFYYTSLIIINDFSKDQIFIVLKGFYKIILISLLYTSLLGILQFYYPEFFLSAFKIYEVELTDFVLSIESNFSYSFGMNRMNSIFLTPIVFGGFLTLAILFLYMLKNDYLKSKSVFFYVTISCGLLALLLSNARAAMIALIICMVLLFLFKKKLKISYMMIILFISYLVFQLVFDKISLSNENLVRLDEIVVFATNGFKIKYAPVNIVARLNELDYVWSNFSGSNFMIYGINNSFFLNKFASTAISYDNQFFAWFINFGIFGLFINIWLIYIPFFFKKHSKLSNDSIAKNTLRTLCYIFIAEIIMAVSQENVFARRWREFIFAFIPIVWMYYKKSNEDDDKQAYI